MLKKYICLLRTPFLCTGFSPWGVDQEQVFTHAVAYPHGNLCTYLSFIYTCPQILCNPEAHISKYNAQFLHVQTCAPECWQQGENHGYGSWESILITIHEGKKQKLLFCHAPKCWLSRHGVCCGWEIQKAGMSFLIFPRTYSSVKKNCY